MGLKTCDLCGMNYVEGDPSEEQRHKEEKHDGFLAALFPSPSTDLAHAIDGNPEAQWVDQRAPDWIRREIYWRAKVFQREFRYDTVQWEIEGRYDPDAVGYVFRDQDFRIVGACCFRPIESGSPHIRLDWIWLAPSARRTGLISREWASFRDRFGVFSIGGPVSDALGRFLMKSYRDHKIARPYIHDPVVPMEQFVQDQYGR